VQAAESRTRFMVWILSTGEHEQLEANPEAEQKESGHGVDPARLLAGLGAAKTRANAWPKVAPSSIAPNHSTSRPVL
jgi:hypothetical protein